jgi:acetylornithine deacetylase
MTRALHSDAIRRLRDYVAIPSVNPMGRTDIAPSILGEARLARHLEAELRTIGVDARLVGEGSRLSVVGEVRARDPIDTVMVASHLDTVPVDRMEIDPFDPEIAAGCLLGRGSCDTKGGMAALVAALARVLGRGALRRNLILVGEADEEQSSAGVRDVLADLGARRPDWVLATEPTELAVVHAHKGVLHVRLEARGRACHASDPGAGRNAVVALSRAAVALDALAARLAARPDPVLGPGTLSIGLMQGGQAPNIVPDTAFLVADRRLLPGETPARAREEVEDALRVAGVSDDVSVTACTLEKPTLGTPVEHAAVHACRSALRASRLADHTATVAFGTDAGVFEQAGVPGVVMGPGSIRRAHTAREFVEVDQVEAMTDFFVALLEGR